MSIDPEARRRGRPGSGQSESIQSLVKALAILDCLAYSDSPIGVTEVASQIGVPKATAHRLLATLLANDAVAYSPDSQRYSLGSSIMRYGLMGVQRLSLHRTGRAYLETLHEVTGETAVLAIRQGDAKMFIDQIESQEEIRHKASLGRRLPLYHGGAGLAILAYMKPAEIDAYLSQGNFAKIESNTIVDPDRLRKELELVRKRGYGVTQSDRITSIGSPVFDHMRVVVGAIAVFAPTYRVPYDHIAKYAQTVKTMAEKLSANMGYTASVA
jgi:DNA-binding IclR family transcriptional regulator